MIVFGLGNPLRRYQETRHNVGFMVIDKLAKQLGLRFTHQISYHIACQNDELVLIKPMLYMNNSGIAIAEYLKSQDSTLANTLSGKPEKFFIVVCDDLALPLGKIRIREKGHAGGHNGLASIIYHLQTIDFPRLRIGIGKLPVGISATDYVLSKFSKTEKPILEKVIETSCQALLTIKESGIKTAMNKYNSWSLALESEKVNN